MVNPQEYILSISRHGLVGFNFPEPTLHDTRLGYIKNYCAIYLNYQYISNAFLN